MKPLILALAIVNFGTVPGFALSPSWKPCGLTNLVTSPDQDVKAYGVPRWAIQRQRRLALESWRKFVANGYKTPGVPDWANEQEKKNGPNFIDATDPAWANHALCNAAKREYVFCWAGWEDNDPNDPGIRKCREATRSLGVGGMYCIDLERPHDPKPVRKWLRGYLSGAAPSLPRVQYQAAAASIATICHGNPNWTLEGAAHSWVYNLQRNPQ